MLAELENHPHARAVLAPALATPSHPSHAYLFHGPGGAGKRAAARALAAELLAEGEANPDSARARVVSGAHPDLTWVVPSGAHEILVSDIDEPVISAASRTPFESSRRVFVIERADELGDEAANRMLKTLEEPAAFVHLILLTDRLGEILPTIRSRCQTVRFEAPSEEAAAAALSELGVSDETALACVRLSLQDADQARELAGAEGHALRAAAEAYARCAIRGEMAETRPWTELLSAVRARGEAAGSELEAMAAAELELTARKDRKRVETEWSERIRRTRRRVQTGALDLGPPARLPLVRRSGAMRPTEPAIWCATATALPSSRTTPAAIRCACDTRSSWWRTLGSASCSMCRRIWHARRWRTACSRRCTPERRGARLSPRAGPL